MIKTVTIKCTNTLRQLGGAIARLYRHQFKSSQQKKKRKNESVENGFNSKWFTFSVTLFGSGHLLCVCMNVPVRLWLIWRDFLFNIINVLTYLVSLSVLITSHFILLFLSFFLSSKYEILHIRPQFIKFIHKNIIISRDPGRPGGREEKMDSLENTRAKLLQNYGLAKKK